MTPADHGVEDVARAESLVARFHRPKEAFARFAPPGGAALPAPFRALLDHASHMTVAMERFYGGPVGVEVVAVHDVDGGGDGAPAWYEREIVLRTADGKVVQHGIVRIDLGCVTHEVSVAIRAGRMPLGRLLITAGMLLEVQRVGLLRVDIGPELRALLEPDAVGGPPARATFGRVAEIALDGVPAVELLEIVAPGPLPKVLP